MELKIKLYEGKESRTVEISKQEGIEKPAMMTDKNFAQEGNNADVFIERVRKHYAKKFIKAELIKDEAELETVVDTITVDTYMDKKLQNLKKMAKTAKGTKLELINEAIAALTPAKKERVKKEKLSDEEFNAVAEAAKADLGRTVEFDKYGKAGEKMTGTIIGIRKDKRVNGVQYIIDTHDENGQRTGVKFGKVVGSKGLTFTSEPVDWEAQKAAARAEKAAATKAAKEAQKAAEAATGESPENPKE